MARVLPRRPCAFWCILALLGLLLTGAGCGESFTRQRYDTIYVGQRHKAVRAKLGKPDQTLPGAWIYSSRRPLYSGAILFDKGQVSGKLWSFEKILTARDIEAARKPPPPPEKPVKPTAPKR